VSTARRVQVWQSPTHSHIRNSLSILSNCDTGTCDSGPCVLLFDFSNFHHNAIASFEARQTIRRLELPSCFARVPETTSRDTPSKPNNNEDDMMKTVVAGSLGARDRGTHTHTPTNVHHIYMRVNLKFCLQSRPATTVAHQHTIHARIPTDSEHSRSVAGEYAALQTLADFRALILYSYICNSRFKLLHLTSLIFIIMQLRVWMAALLVLHWDATSKCVGPDEGHDTCNGRGTREIAL
jgi:hypothetical protein